MKDYACECHVVSEVHTTYRCELCEQMFNSQQELIQHQISNHGQRSRKLPINLCELSTKFL
jgi:hypothetical protein